jgi:hypothetical protein
MLQRQIAVTERCSPAREELMQVNDICRAGR